MKAMASQITGVSVVYSTVLFRHRSKKTSKPRATGLCDGNSRITGEIPAHRTSNVEKKWWRYHGRWGRETPRDCLNYYMWQDTRLLTFLCRKSKRVITAPHHTLHCSRIIVYCCSHFYYHGLILITAWISNYIHDKVWDEITHSFLNFKGATVDV